MARSAKVQVAAEAAPGNLLERLTEVRWGLPSAKRKALLERMTKIALAKGTEDSTAVKAFLALVEAEKLDLAAVRLMIDGFAVSKIVGQTDDAGSTITAADLAAGVARLLATYSDEAPGEAAGGEGNSNRSGLDRAMDLYEEIA